MPTLFAPPRCPFLVDQVAPLRRREIQSGRWRVWLLGPRRMIKLLSVSRPTIRAALRQLIITRELALHPRREYRVRRSPGEDTFLHVLSPTPALYRVNLELIARRLFRSVLRTAGAVTRPHELHRVVPQFVPGESLGRAPADTN